MHINNIRNLGYSQPILASLVELHQIFSDASRLIQTRFHGSVSNGETASDESLQYEQTIAQLRDEIQVYIYNTGSCITNAKTVSVSEFKADSCVPGQSVLWVIGDS